MARKLAVAALAAALPGILFCASGASASRHADGSVGVAVYRSPAASAREMPAGCRLLAESAPLTMSESDLDASGAFSRERASAAAAGANVLLRVEAMIAPRQNFDCAAAQPISDCPMALGAWYRVVLRTYSCDDASRALLAPVASGRRASES